jgi:hypothetical protein
MWLGGGVRQSAGTVGGGIFWTQSLHGREEEQGSIGRARLDGSGADGHFIVGAKAPAGVALDGGYVYWANYGSGTIARAKLDGSDVDKRFITGADDPIGVAVDSRHIYWTNSGVDPNSGTIGRANLDGSGVNQHFIRAGDSPLGLAMDASYIYWTHRYWNRDLTRRGDAIGRANLDGSGVNQHFIDASNNLTGVAVNGRYVYWSNSGEDTIGRANLDGTAVDQRCLSPRSVPLGNVPEGPSMASTSTGRTTRQTRSGGRTSMDRTPTSVSSSSTACRKGSRLHRRVTRLIVTLRKHLPGAIEGTDSRWTDGLLVELLLSGLGRGSASDNVQRRSGGQRDDLGDPLAELGRQDRDRPRSQPDLSAARRLLPPASRDRAPCLPDQALQTGRAPGLHTLHGPRTVEARRPDGEMVRVGTEHVRQLLPLMPAAPVRAGNSVSRLNSRGWP